MTSCSDEKDTLLEWSKIGHTSIAEKESCCFSILLPDFRRDEGWVNHHTVKHVVQAFIDCAGLIVIIPNEIWKLGPLRVQLQQVNQSTTVKQNFNLTIELTITRIPPKSGDGDMGIISYFPHISTLGTFSSCREPPATNSPYGISKKSKPPFPRFKNNAMPCDREVMFLRRRRNCTSAAADPLERSIR